MATIFQKEQFIVEGSGPNTHISIVEDGTLDRVHGLPGIGSDDYSYSSIIESVNKADLLPKTLRQEDVRINGQTS